MSMSTSSQFLSVPQLSHRSSQHPRSGRGRSATQSSTSSKATQSSTSSKVKLEDSPLSPDAFSPPPAPQLQAAHTSSPPFLSSASQTLARRASPPSLPSLASNLSAPILTASQKPQLSPRSIFRVVPFLVRLRSPPSDLLSLSCSSGAPRTHAVLRRSQLQKASQTLTYGKTLVCADAVNAEVLLRLARNEILERAQQANRLVTALVDEEWQYNIRQAKSGDYNVQVSYSACPAQGEDETQTLDPRKPIALSHVTNIPGLMRIVHSK
ncbi:hypothetical protein B0F90DRAFT_459628 [Multifurca ochricompacta]|uniref:Uncharacterized protein n=1 Tax=Multifurca ochricompacta TaxID=376703 RepID=A0AAD4QN50_9AGAM|nr:hypothetical protein B0F90DRAFT_459628 [Multifurca ochricompacta]